MGNTYTYVPWTQPYTAQQLQEAAEHQGPIIGANNHWMVWNIGTMRYEDTGVAANPGTGVIPDGAITPEKLSPATKQIAVGRNMLDNWYFVGGGSQQGGGQFPINQRGATSYSGAVYGIDRWRGVGAGLNTDIDDIDKDGLIISTSTEARLRQTLDEGIYYSIVGKTATASVLFSDGTLISGTATVPETDWLIFGSVNNRPIMQMVGTEHSFHLFMPANSTSKKIAAVKLELGSNQTLAHQENGVWVLNELPNYSVELLKCQRWFQTFRTQSLRPTYGADFRPVMRTDPTMGTITIGGEAYYTASAE